MDCRALFSVHGSVCFLPGVYRSGAEIVTGEVAVLLKGRVRVPDVGRVGSACHLRCGVRFHEFVAEEPLRDFSPEV
jgi:hypothetical protein